MYGKETWDNIFEDPIVRWKEASKHIKNSINLLEEMKVKEILDLGAGTGRHLVYLNKRGFKVSGCDFSFKVKKFALKQLKKLGIKGIKYNICDMHDLSYPNNSFDAVISINVIHHTDYPGMKKVVGEISRVLKQKGLFIGTLVSQTNDKFGKGRRIDKYTYVSDKGKEKDIPHCFLDKQAIQNLFHDFNLLKLKMVLTKSFNMSPERIKKLGNYDYHYLIIAERIN